MNHVNEPDSFAKRTSDDEPRCDYCDVPLLFVHGHYQCDNAANRCPRRGQNQIPCCQP
jgi:hypothetical protein